MPLFIVDTLSGFQFMRTFDKDVGGNRELLLFSEGNSREKGQYWPGEFLEFAKSLNILIVPEIARIPVSLNKISLLIISILFRVFSLLFYNLRLIWFDAFFAYFLQHHSKYPLITIVKQVKNILTYIQP